MLISYDHAEFLQLGAVVLRNLVNAIAIEEEHNIARKSQHLQRQTAALLSTTEHANLLALQQRQAAVARWG